jgi:hypothetical protein
LLIDELTKQVFDTLKHHPWKMDIHGVTSIARLFNSIPMQFREGVTKKRIINLKEHSSSDISKRGRVDHHVNSLRAPHKAFAASRLSWVNVSCLH